MKTLIISFASVVFSAISLMAQPVLMSQANNMAAPGGGIIKDSSIFSAGNKSLTRYRFANTTAIKQELTIPHESNNFTFDILSVKDRTIFVSVAENKTQNFYYSIDEGSNWMKIVKMSDDQRPVFTYLDNEAFVAYFDIYPYEAKYKLDLRNNKWSAIPFKPYRFEVIKLNHDLGYIRVFDTPGNLNGKIAYTNDGCKTYTIIQKVNYNEAPFNTTNSGTLYGIEIINDNYWMARYSVESNGAQQCSLMFSIDAGSNWNILIPNRIDQVAVASDNTVYAYVSNGGIMNGHLFQISDNGNKIRKVNFNGTIKSMSFGANGGGIILTLDTPNLKPGVWFIKDEKTDIESMNAVQEKSKKYSHFEVFPNPATTEIYVTVSEDADYTILNLVGQLVVSGKLTKSENRIDVSNLSRGAYLIKVGNDIRKWVKE